MWAFDGSVDVDADVQIALELRQEISDLSKDAEKDAETVASMANASDDFRKMCAKLKELCSVGQDSGLC